jgi:hypothetical protein
LGRPEERFLMRLWTIHPKHLDRLGLVAVWREGLLAQAVLEDKTKGYKNHPQLKRFRIHPEPLQAIAYYLHEVYLEAKARGYNFDRSKFNHDVTPSSIQISSGQLDFEVKHLLSKLEERSKKHFDLLVESENIAPHPLFEIVPGDVEDWEKGTKKIVTS